GERRLAPAPRAARGGARRALRRAAAAGSARHRGRDRSRGRGAAAVIPAGALELGAALALDRCFGDPRGLPHPVRWIGAAALWLEPRCAAALGRTRLAGALFCAAIVGGSAAAVALALALAGACSPAARSALAIYLLYTALAARDLDRHATAVARGLAAG